MAAFVTVKSVSRFCWQLLAVVLVLFALAVSLIRGLLPQVDEVRQQLVDYIKNEYHLDVQVGELSAQWQAFGPALTIENLIIPPQHKVPVTVLVKNIQIKLDFWQSLLKTSPRIEDVNFDGIRLALDIDKLIEDSSVTTQSNVYQTDWLYKLLLKQLERFSLTDVSVQLLSQQHEYRPIHIRHLNWRNNGDSHRGAGQVYLDNHASMHESLQLQLDIKGDGATPDSLTGQIYLAAQSLDLGEWASRQSHPDEPSEKLPLEGVINLKAWLTFAQRSIHSGMIHFEPSWLEWAIGDKPQKFEINSGSITWLPTASGWEVNSTDLDFITNGEAWPELTLALKQQGDELFGYASQLELQTLFPLLPLFPSVDLAALKQWYQLAPEGGIGPIRVYHKKGEPWLANTDIKQLHWRMDEGVPNANPLDAHLQWQDKTLVFSLPEQAYTLNFGDEFPAPLVLNGAAIVGQFDTESLTLSVPQIRFDNDDIALDAAVKLDFSAAVLMSLAANVEVKNAANADKYFPVKAMGESLAKYLDDAIKAGHSQNAQVLWQGALANFPFDDNSGVFQAAFTLQDAQFQFQPDWPAVTDLSLDALFENARMDIWVNQGKLMDVIADGAHVFIPELGEYSLLKIQAELATQGRAATQVLQASPLADSVGKTLNVVQVQGAVTGNLDISIPLYEGEDEDIRGQISFDNTPVYIAQPGILLNGVTGIINFTNQVITGKGIKARLFEQPLSFTFDTQPKGKDFALNLQLKSRWDLNRLPDELHHPLSDFYQGKISWDGAMDMLFTEQGYQIQAKVTSDMLGTQLSFPGYFAKPEDEPRSLVAEFIGDQNDAILDVKLASHAEFVGGFTADNGTRFSYFDLLLGRLFDEDEAKNTEQGHIQIDLGKAKLAEWLPVINAFVGQEKMPKTGILVDEIPHKNVFPAVASIDSHIGRLDLLGQQLTELRLNAKPNETGWRFNANANEFEGWIDFYPNWMTQGLKIAASKFYFAPELKNDAEADFGAEQVLTNLPPVAVNVEDFHVFDKPFGKLVLQASPQPSGYQIQTLSLATPNVTLKGSGIWQQQDGKNKTELSMMLNATQFNHLTEQLGIDPGVNEAPLKVNADLSWEGAPYAFSLESLNGKVNFALGKGHLSQVSDKGARIFSLFSLDSLVRKLSLDFSDVFGQGMYFNSFTGNLQIDNGVVKTTDTEMDAIAGNMKVRGYTDLTTESLNYDIRFVPQLASSVPTVVLLSTSAWTLGLGAFALTKVLEPVIEVISEIRFRVTGTMAEPVVEELERKSKEIEIPESILPIIGAGDKAMPTEGNNEQHTPKLGPKASEDMKLGEPLPQGSQPDTMPPEPAIKPIEPTNSQDVKPIKQNQGDNNAHQPVAMSEQSRRQRQSAVYRIAA
ncbi:MULTISPECIES: YhdP family protein [unclassified Shewanella]|uniref:YhdP family protein n=1 Tax=unclassified Shewanella TaxID=196818 RepID=UPI002006D57F|nr:MULTISPECIES: YhdP family protein [unclassified Shewanella]MCK7636131.1 TIGR02099 family protein [Shewanella sp. JNE17]MCK7651302.1 TIGR02099 family protein [Shewanella sp. JNE8]MCK7659543.1 TIGR02099 family protein [Shewanella sp. JNE4-2]UPO31747.1 TIGR02099 family protein [Shewanella sp. JNE2]